MIQEPRTSTGEAGSRSARRKPRQTGAILVVVLVSLLVLMMIGSTLIQTLLLHHREARRTEHSQQSFWLAESATQRAASRVAASADYAGETWRVPPEVLGGDAEGVAVIRLEKLEGQPDARRIVVEASYPEDSSKRILHRRERTVHLSSDSGDSP